MPPSARTAGVCCCAVRKVRDLARQAHGERVVVAEFADIEALMRWHDSAEYQALVALREAGAEVVLTAYQT